MALKFKQKNTVKTSHTTFNNNDSTFVRSSKKSDLRICTLFYLTLIFVLYICIQL